MKSIIKTASISLLALLLMACSKLKYGPGNTTTTEKQVNSYSTLDLNGSFDYILTNNNSQTIKIVAGSRITKYIKTTVNDGVLEIKEKKNLSTIFTRTGDVKIYIPAQSVNSITLNGSGNVTSDNLSLNTTDFSADLNGSGNISLDIDCQTSTLKLSGSGNIEVSGNSNNNNIDLSGSGNLNTFNLVTDNTQASLSGSGNVNVNVKTKLTVELSGSGAVVYMGTPTIEQHITGSGNIKPY